jgi:hypothetical protein
MPEANQMNAPETPTYQQVLTQAERLELADKLQLLEALAAQLRPHVTASRGHRTSEFRGIGHVTWNGTDAQDYVNRERNTWVG